MKSVERMVAVAVTAVLNTTVVSLSFLTRIIMKSHPILTRRTTFKKKIRKS